MRILFVTQPLGFQSACGVALGGQLVGESLVKSKKYHFEILYTDSKKEVKDKIKLSRPHAVIYNYHSITSPWMAKRSIRRPFPQIAHIMLHHDMDQTAIDHYDPAKYFGFKYLVTADPTLKGNDHVFIINRLIPPYPPQPYVDRGIPIIGFHGFGPPHKGIHRIAEKVQEEFDEAIIRLHIPFSFFGDLKGKEAKKRVEEVRNIIKKPGIKIEVSHELVPPGKIVELLSQNTINCYFYDCDIPNAGIASSPDYALAARRPIAVTKSNQLKNLAALTPSICIEDNSLKDIISFGTHPLEKLYDAYSEENVIKGYEAMLDTILLRRMQQSPQFLIKRSLRILKVLMTRSPIYTARKIVSKLKNTSE